MGKFMGKDFTFTVETNGLKRQDSRVIIPVCIGWQNSEGEKFKAFVSTARNTYKEIKFAVAADLYAYVEAITNNTSFENELEKARQKGIQWIARNQENQLILAKEECIFWQEFEKTSHYLKAAELIREKFNTDKHFRSAIHKTILDRSGNPKYKKSSNFDMRKYTELSEQYILDECVKYVCWAEDGYHFVAHLDDLSDALKYVYDNFIWPNHKDRAIYDKAREKKSELKKIKPTAVESSFITSIEPLKKGYNSTRFFQANKLEQNKSSAISSKTNFDEELSKETDFLAFTITLLMEKLDQEVSQQFKQELLNLMNDYSPKFSLIINYISENTDMLIKMFCNQYIVLDSEFRDACKKLIINYGQMVWNLSQAIVKPESSYISNLTLQ